MSKPDLKMDMEKDLVYPVSGTREDWEARSDVIYHMYAYQFFSYMSGKKTGIDLVNMTDGDKEYYNNLSRKYKGTKNYPELAHYLLDFMYTHPTVYNAGEFRRALISHARDYNLTTKDVRRSFHMINLTDLELHSVSLDTNQPRRTVPYERYGQKRYIALATDGILTNIVAGEKDRDERYVGEKVHEYIRHHKNPEVAARYGKETEFYLGPPRDTIPAESKVTLVVADGGNADPVIYKAVGGIIVTETDEDSVQGLGSA